MTSNTLLIISSLLLSPSSAFQAQAGSGSISTTTGTTSNLNAASLIDSDQQQRPIYDPFNLYPETSPEKLGGRIRTLEPEQIKVIKPVVDPLRLYPLSSSSSSSSSSKTTTTTIDEGVDMSDAVPFLPRPVLLTREMAGDVGFDPFNFADTSEKLAFMRVAELKHSRIAMLAALGWPMSEALNKPLANIIHMKPLLLEQSFVVGGGSDDRVPSLLNGGLGNVSPFYWMLVLGLAGGFEIASQINGEESSIFDPLNIYPTEDDTEGRMWWDTAEIKNGRLAMMGIAGYVVQELFTKTGVIHQIPIVSSLLSSSSSAAVVPSLGNNMDVIMKSAADLMVKGFSA
eukprot:CAMPEP_0202458570 /NCGR_PEP_ID=MMETSP1360-20130828/26457_1 /ASSEMBLY_ACC=CAM_ASM_000848 /TAXON_ID=515479 /ORGANISM="Licmophora paradoxa, Strain CCMP2313" /LENGTH=341 /DNA_ID=CAMNT_0049079175 /DNA_START=45 /DNA_END=1070 /DNA_ORIENTATION=-